MARDKLIIYGNGQMARMFLHFARLEFDVVALTVDSAVLTEDSIEGLPVVAFEALETRFPPAGHSLITAVGYREMNALRARKTAEARARGYRLARYVHPSVVRHANVTIGDNSIVLDHVALHPGTRIGEGVFIASNVSVGHGCRIGDWCWINSGVSIGGETVVGDATFLGMNATLGDNISVGRQCYVGAQTLVTRPTEAESVHISPNGERFPMRSQAFLEFLARSAG